MKKIRNIRVLCLLFAAIIFTMLGCSKSSTNGYLLGLWNRINIKNVDSTTFYEAWEFQTGGVFIIHYAPPNPDVQGVWTLKSYSKFSISLPDDKTYYLYNGTWQIVRRKSHNMMIVFDMTQLPGPGGGLEFREFQR